ncbi:MAG TPA: hypothetical protein PLL54_02755 [Dermatophilaceae bacterium]|nr:hypothetical protein [Dermatophilaceae bacterium]
MPRRPPISPRSRWALLWVAVVVITCTLTWATIMRVADDVSMIGGPGLVAAPSRVTGPAVTEGVPAMPTPATLDDDHDATPAPSTDSAPTSTPVRTTPGAKPKPAANPAPAPPVVAPAVPAAPPPDPAVQRTLRTDAGTIVAACTGDVLALRSVTPADGWSVRQERESSKVKVTFARGDQSHEVEVTCRSGSPTFTGD